MARLITMVIIHCTASSVVAHNDISVIREWHLARGWDDVGYHAFVKLNGDIQLGRPYSQIGAHAHGYNKNSIGIVFHGDAHPNQKQFKTLVDLSYNLMESYNLKPEDFIGHNEVNKSKDCPCFDVEEIRKVLHAKDF